MSLTVMPAFFQCADEAAIIGRLLAGYGELEFQLCTCLSLGLGDEDTGVRVMFRLRSERGRLDVADALMRGPYAEAALETEYAEAIGAARGCLKLRNQYAHRHWVATRTGLWFTNLEDAATSSSGALPRLPLRRLSVELLRDQEAYFAYAMDCLLFLEGELKVRRRQIPSSPFEMPPKMQRPAQYIRVEATE